MTATYLVSIPADPAQILIHRLGAADGIADALEEEYDRDDVEARVTQLLSALEGGLQVLRVDELGLEVLIEAAEGSTFFGNTEDWTTAERRRWGRAATLLEERLALRGLDDEVNVPRS